MMNPASPQTNPYCTDFNLTSLRETTGPPAVVTAFMRRFQMDLFRRGSEIFERAPV